MTKSWPRTVVVTLFILLAFATPAAAECAWVLWKSAIARSFTSGQGFSGSVTITPTWEPLGAYDRKDRCESLVAAERTRLTADEQQAGPKLLCLPDTVDPRGPKGK